MRKKMTNKPYPCRLGDNRLKRVGKTAKATELSFAEVIRQAVDAGLPIVQKRFSKKT